MTPRKSSKTHSVVAPEVGSIGAEVTTPEAKERTKTALVVADVPKPANVKTVNQVFADFCEPLSKEERKLATETLEAVIEGQKQMIESALSIGTALQRLRDGIGSESFQMFATNVLPRLGIPRSTAYKWLGKSIAGAHVFRNPVARQYLYRLTDGAGILDANTGAMTEGAKKVLAALPMPKPGDVDAKGCELWAQSFVQAVRKETQASRSAQGVDIDKLQESYVNAFDRLNKNASPHVTLDAIARCFSIYLASDKYKAKEAEGMVNKLDNLYTDRTKQIDAAKAASKSTAA